MGTRDSFTGADDGSGGGFIKLLESREVHGLAMGEDFMYPSAFSSDKPSRMLCFGDGRAEPVFGIQKSGVTGSDSSSTSSSCSGGSSFSKLTMQTEGIGEDGKAEQKRRSGSGRKACKKTKTEAPVKARKEKIGERIVALQQLVSPFGKTDTASVLHEAMGYIRFLHDQVQVLSSPYLQRLPTSGGEGGEGRYELRSRGLCLVPVESTVHVAGSNGADFWSPAMAMGSSNSSSSNR